MLLLQMMSLVCMGGKHLRKVAFFIISEDVPTPVVLSGKQFNKIHEPSLVMFEIFCLINR